MSGGFFNAVFGRIFSGGVERELRGGLDFSEFLSAEPDNAADVLNVRARYIPPRRYAYAVSSGGVRQIGVLSVVGVETVIVHEASEGLGGGALVLAHATDVTSADDDGTSVFWATGQTPGGTEGWRALALRDVGSTLPGVNVAPYDSIIVGDAGNGLGGGTTSSEFLVRSQRHRIRQSGSLLSVSFYVAAVPTGCANFKVRIWRPSVSDGSGVISLVGETEDLTSQLVAGRINTIELGAPIPGVLAGDMYGIRWEGNDAAVNAVRAHLGRSNCETYYEFNAAAWVNGHAIAGTHVDGCVWPCLMTMAPPYAVFVGNSITQGVPINYAFTQNDNDTTDDVHYWGAILSASRGWSYQNMGHGSDTMSEIAARISTDVVALRPTVCVLEGGINDIVVSGATAAQVCARYDEALSALYAAGIRTYLQGVLPDTNTTTDQARACDTVNAHLASVAADYNAQYIGAEIAAAVGEFRAGGDPGNLWNLQAAFTADGVHLNQAGQAAQAAAIDAVI